MALCFVETMRGTLTDQEERAVPVDFEVRATHLGGGRFALEGVVHAGTWADEATCWGTLELTALPPRIRYRVSFLGPGGQTYALVGAKLLRARQPLTSVTTLPLELEDASGARLARGLLVFDLFELPSFVLSALPLGTAVRRRFEARRLAVGRSELEGG